MGFKENVKDEMSYNGLQPRELAEKAGINVNTLNHYLVPNATSPSAENALKIARALGVSVEYLMTGEESRARESPYRTEVRALADRLSSLSGRDLSLVDALVSRMETAG